MKKVYHIFVLLALSFNLAYPNGILAATLDIAASDDEFGITQYPLATHLPEATRCLTNIKADSWLFSKVFRTDSHIQDVTNYFGVVEQKTSKEERVYSGKEVDQKVRIWSRPVPVAPEPGIVIIVLRAVFSKTGKVRKIEVVSGTKYPFTRAAIEAARRIKFEPAIKDGRYVSQGMLLEYRFGEHYVSPPQLPMRRNPQ